MRGIYSVAGRGDYETITLTKSIVAVYDSQMYTVNFWNEETLLKSQEVQHGSWAIAPAAPEAPEGYYFSGWDQDYRKVEGNLDIHAVFEEYQTGQELITTEEYIRRIKELDMPEEMEESIINLGIVVREAVDQYQGKQSRNAVPIEPGTLEYLIMIASIITLPQVATAMAIVVVAVGAVILTGFQFYLIWHNFQLAMEILGEYVGEPIAKAITAELTMSIELELEAEGDSEALLIETMTLSMAIAATIAKGKEDEPTIIYRMGSGNATNLTPRVVDITGLSYQLTAPNTGPYTVTSIELINATGKLIAIQDGPNHVSVIPINITRMPEWIDSRPNALVNPHEFTKAIAGVSVKVK